ncbi:hypothetical protein H4W34_005511 [Actinomadura algeriensis]|uniref:MFS transporter n=1 Tax=Actinomadura algeriensis TaxID=1679523 RepID=A0ABR9JYZ0_9ACTN|nr:hypothetical protein [Actinomadura algeriensis]
MIGMFTDGLSSGDRVVAVVMCALAVVAVLSLPLRVEE